MRRLAFLTLAFCLCLSCLPASSALCAESATLGIVLLHGKYGAPDKHVSDLGATLRSTGYLVAMPEMPWSRRRGYDADYPQALAEIDAAVRDLRAKGARSVVVGGHSLGGNAALAYAARYPGLAGVLCLAAAHTPDVGKQRELAAPNVQRAKERIAAGQGDAQARFSDMNMGKTYEMLATPVIYLSYYDPEGLANMPRSAAMIAPPLPILWVAGSRDPLSRHGREHAFDRAPSHPLSSYQVVDADHLGTPSAAAPLVLEWLKTLPR